MKINTRRQKRILMPAIQIRKGSFYTPVEIMTVLNNTKRWQMRKNFPHTSQRDVSGPIH